MAELTDALAAAVRAPVGEATPQALVEAAGSKPALARILAGTPAGKLPATGTQARRDYEAAKRRVQRWTTTGAQKRRAPASAVAALRDKLQQRATSDRIDKLARTGARVRIVARVVVPSPGRKVDSRRRELPSGGPGVVLQGEAVREWGRALLAGDEAGAAGAFLDAFADAYGIPPSTVLEDVEQLKVWADDEPEP